MGCGLQAFSPLAFLLSPHQLYYQIIEKIVLYNTITIQLLKNAIGFMKRKLPDLQQVGYFFRWMYRLCKNLKNFHFLCYHKADFGLNSTMPFFVTSCGKSTFEGITGTAMRLFGRVE